MDRSQLSGHLWEHRTAMLRLAMSMLRHPQNAEDAVSAAMVQAYQHCEGLRQAESVKPWLMRITANACRDQLRRDKRLVLLPNPGCEAAETFAFEGDQPLLDALLRLPAPTAQVLTLYYYDNYDTREIAAILRVPPATVRARLSRGRKMLQKQLAEGRDGDEDS